MDATTTRQQRDTVSITINGTETEVDPRETVLTILRNLGIAVPTLCHDDRLTPYGGCRLCVVERTDGRGGLVPACSTPVQRGMAIETDSEAVVDARRRQLQLLLLNHRLECPVCERSGDCRLQDLFYEYGTPEEQFPFELRRAPRDEASPVIVRDPEKCILCGRCVRLCDEVQGVAEIGIINRGLNARVATVLDRPLDCEFCGQCVNACPVGALVARPYNTEAPAWLRERETTTCSLCSCGCQVTVETYQGALQRVTADPATEPNRGKLCVKGWLGWDILSNPERLTRPLVRREGQLVETGWEEALAEAARGVASAKAVGRAVVGVGSSRLTVEDAFLLQSFLRDVAGSPHVGVGPVGGVDALVDGMAAATGVPRSTATFDDLRAADFVLVLRADPTRTHPLVKTELVQAVKQRGRSLILAHALSGGLERHSDAFLRVNPGTEDTLLLGLAALAIAAKGSEDLADVPGRRAWIDGLARFTPEAVKSVTGVAPGALRRAADALIAAAAPVAVVVTGLGIPGDEVTVATAATQLMSILGAESVRPRVLVLGEKANVQGVLDAGLHPRLRPGGKPAAAVDQPEVGWRLDEAMRHAAEGDVGCLYLAGEDPVGSWPRPLAGRAGLRGADFVIVQDAFLTETARLADVVLPVAILGERLGTVVGADGVPRRLRRALAPPEALPQDGDVLVELARRLGGTLPAGLDLREQVVAVLQVAERPPRLELGAPVASAPKAAPAGLLLDPSPELFHSGLVTGRSRLLQGLSPTVALRLSPEDAAAAGVGNGEGVKVCTNGREVLLRARIDREVRQGTVVVPWYGGEDAAAVLLGDSAEPVTGASRRGK